MKVRKKRLDKHNQNVLGSGLDGERIERSNPCPFCSISLDSCTVVVLSLRYGETRWLLHVQDGAVRLHRGLAAFHESDHTLVSEAKASDVIRGMCLGDACAIASVVKPDEGPPPTGPEGAENGSSTQTTVGLDK